ncbi:diacylglycerol kinase family protein [Pleomorphomonas sp. JP5]|uniref:diacylglycerol/lipid kinase family protein n=1 Tax=Pleomorphomonas sp. JP5 TaxID=2942998 RepID=UPI002042FF7F|nr:diacylglycerol kinase family protein [Pleomorphomonas sp. JP5]MCM5559051.1 diacylglycerol kinase family lipid kinase [Pleomorphomonas sp. JP5]
MPHEAAPILVVANPVAGNFNYRHLMRLAERLDRLGLKSDIWLTRYSGELSDIALELSPSVRTLVVGGGDGSINEAITGIVRRGGDGPALSILPFGTANVLAHELGLPSSPEKIAERIAAGRKTPLHLGMVGERPFALMVSAGFDADIVHAVEAPFKRRWGKLAYGWRGLALALAQKGRDVTVIADGETIKCRIAVVTTARFYGGPLTITRHTKATEQGLRLVTLADDRPATLLRAATALALGRLERLATVQDRPVTEVRFSGEGIRMQIDGDRMETTDAVVRSGRIIDVLA